MSKWYGIKGIVSYLVLISVSNDHQLVLSLVRPRHETLSVRLEYFDILHTSFRYSKEINADTFHAVLQLIDLMQFTSQYSLFDNKA